MNLDAHLAARSAPRQPTIYAHRKQDRDATYPERLGSLIRGCPVLPDALQRSGDSRLAIFPTDPLRGDPQLIDWDATTAEEICSGGIVPARTATPAEQSETMHAGIPVDA